MQAMEVRDREIELRLESYARARLSPDPQSVARARARIMREARLQFEASRIAAHMAPAVITAPRRPMLRRVAMPLVAAGVWIGIAVGSISAAQPGGPLYPTRMWVENATLPNGGVARANTELTRLEARLYEAGAAAARGDAGAVQAALDAYRQIADETIAAAAGDADLEALVAAALDKHRVVLAAVAASLDGRGDNTAAAAVEASIQRAIAHNQAVIDRIDEHNASGAGGSGGGGGAGAGGGSTGGAGSTPGGATGTGTGTDGKPEKTPKPTPPPKPTPTPDPSGGRGQPDHTPRGQNQ